MKRAAVADHGSEQQVPRLLEIFSESHEKILVVR